MSSSTDVSAALQDRHLQYLRICAKSVALAAIGAGIVTFSLGGLRVLPLCIALGITAVGVALSLRIVARGGSIGTGSHFFMGSFLLGMSMVVWLSGGIASPGMIPLIFGAPMSVLIVSVRGSIVWGAISAVELILIGIWRLAEWDIHNLLLPEESLVMLWVALAVVLVVLFLLLVHYQVSFSEQLESATLSNRRLSDAREEVAAAHEAFAKSALVVGGGDTGTGLVGKMQTQSDRGSTALRTAREQIDSMFHSYTDIRGRVTTLREQSNQITNHLSTIKRISTKLDIMAINTALEAAHAREHGKNFAPLANEMRRLAEAAIDEIASIHDGIGQVMTQSDEVGEAVTQSSSTATDARRRLRELEAVFGDVLELFQQSTTAAQEARALGNRQLASLDVLLEHGDEAGSETN